MRLGAFAVGKQPLVPKQQFLQQPLQQLAGTVAAAAAKTRNSYLTTLLKPARVSWAVVKDVMTATLLQPLVGHLWPLWLVPVPSERLVFEPAFLIVALPIVTEWSERGGEGLPYTARCRVHGKNAVEAP